jgi:molybdopterin biosynthesis enzyme
LVHSKPRVAVLSTGEEVAEFTSTPGPSQIRDSNRPVMIAILESEGCEVSDLGIAGDKFARFPLRF